MLIVRSKLYVLVSWAQLVGTMHNIWKVQGSNSGHHKQNKKDQNCIAEIVLVKNAQLFSILTVQS